MGEVFPLLLVPKICCSSFSLTHKEEFLYTPSLGKQVLISSKIRQAKISEWLLF